MLSGRTILASIVWRIIVPLGGLVLFLILTASQPHRPVFLPENLELHYIADCVRITALTVWI